MKVNIMFADPIIIANTGTSLTIPRVDAGQKAGKYMAVVPGTSIDEFNIRNSSYFSKTDKRSYDRHNIELVRTTTIAATAISPETFKKVKVYLVIEHDSRTSLAEIQAAADQVANFVIEANNPGFVQKLVNNEG